MDWQSYGLGLVTLPLLAILFFVSLLIFVYVKRLMDKLGIFVYFGGEQGETFARDNEVRTVRKIFGPLWGGFYSTRDSLTYFYSLGSITKGITFGISRPPIMKAEQNV